MTCRRAIAAALFTGTLFAQDVAPRNTQPGVRYVGDRACRNCHGAIADSFARTPMGRSAAAPSVSDPLGEFRQSAEVRVKATGRTYRSQIREGKVIHSSDLESYEVAYAIGSGTNGRSYVIRRGGYLFLSPLSFYTARKQWDLSPGFESGVFRDFTRPVALACLNCHTGIPRPDPTLPDRFQEPAVQVLTIGCERCHGPGEIHVQQATQGLAATKSSIANPARLQPGPRDDVCSQCHLGGDIRVLQPGRRETDYRPGAQLDEVVVIFSLPESAKLGGFQAVSQVAQLRASRCWKDSQGKLACFTCHDPHRRIERLEAARHYRARCLGCHQPGACHLSLAKRRDTSPPDNCITCHMPRSRLSNVAHVSHTDHRIVKTAAPEWEEAATAPAAVELVYESARPGRVEPGLRSKALAYAEATLLARPLVSRALRLLGDAVRVLPRDVEVWGWHGVLLADYETGRQEEAARSLERAISLGSSSAAVHRALAGLRQQAGDLLTAERLYRDAIRLEPFDTAAYVALARMYLQQRDSERAAQMVSTLSSVDPAHPMVERLRQELGQAGKDGLPRLR